MVQCFSWSQYVLPDFINASDLILSPLSSCKASDLIANAVYFTLRTEGVLRIKERDIKESFTQSCSEKSLYINVELRVFFRFLYLNLLKNQSGLSVGKYFPLSRFTN